MALIVSKGGAACGPAQDNAARLALSLIPDLADISGRVRAGARELMAVRLRYLGLTTNN